MTIKMNRRRLLRTSAAAGAAFPRVSILGWPANAPQFS